MAPEHDARMRAFYDHESDDVSLRRRRRAAADWGVGEDIFDRMPSRRFKRTDRRAEHRDEADGRHFERRVSGPAQPRAVEDFDDGAPRRDDWADTHERRQVAPRRDDWPDERREAAERPAPRRDDRAEARDGAAGPAAPRRDAAERAAPRRDAAERAAPRREAAERAAPRREAAERAAPPREAAGPAAPAPERRRPRRPAESWTEGDEGSVAVEGKRPIQSWLEPERGESRTIVLEVATPDEELVEEPPARRTVVIKGHPDRLPVPREQRPPRTAVERIGARPDRIVGYAVALGLLLVLIAVLTTG